MTIAVIAVLVSILLPALARMRDRAKDAVCLSNLHQLGAAWLNYTTDHKVFPVADVSGYWGTIRNGWGGVNWFGDGPYPSGYRREPSERPINAYVAQSARVEYRHLLFRCPRDSGCADARTGLRPWDSAARLGSAPAQDLQSCFGFVGTSYRANDWMYCALNAAQGWKFAPVGVAPPNWQPLAPHMVVIAPSRCVMLGDSGAISAGRVPPSLRMANNLWGSFWHGSETGQLVFMDGSARPERSMNTITRQSYSFYLNPFVHKAPLIRYFVDTW